MKNRSLYGLSGVALLGGFIGEAMAAVPEAVTTAITAVEADAVTVATAMIGVIAALLVFAYIRKQLH